MPTVIGPEAASKEPALNTEKQFVRVKVLPYWTQPGDVVPSEAVYEYSEATAITPGHWDGEASNRYFAKKTDGNGKEPNRVVLKIAKSTKNSRVVMSGYELMKQYQEKGDSGRAGYKCVPRVIGETPDGNGYLMEEIDLGEYRPASVHLQNVVVCFENRQERIASPLGVAVFIRDYSSYLGMLSMIGYAQNDRKDGDILFSNRHGVKVLDHDAQLKGEGDRLLTKILVAEQQRMVNIVSGEENLAYPSWDDATTQKPELATWLEKMKQVLAPQLYEILDKLARGRFSTYEEIELASQQYLDHIDEAATTISETGLSASSEAEKIKVGVQEVLLKNSLFYRDGKTVESVADYPELTRINLLERYSALELIQQQSTLRA